MIDILNKCHTDPRLINNHYLTILLITLKVQDIHYFFSKSIPFNFFAILFFEVPMLSTRFSHSRVVTLGTLEVQEKGEGLTSRCHSSKVSG